MKKLFLLLTAIMVTSTLFGQNEYPTTTNSNMKIDGGSIKFIRPVTEGGWARGLNFYNTDGTTYFGALGLFGISNTVNSIYVAYGTNPWSSGLGIYIKPDGKVGIGTTSPDYKLDVAGEIHLNENNLLFSTPTAIGGDHARIKYSEGDPDEWKFSFWQNSGQTAHLTFKSSSEAVGDGLIHLGVGTNNSLTINNGGNVGIGTVTTGTHKLAVEGTIGAREIKVEAPPSWSDFVFKENYKLRKLEEVENFIEENNHLPDIPSEKEVFENGIQVGEMNAKLLQKIEELTLYLIEQNKEINELKEKVKKMETAE